MVQMDGSAFKLERNLKVAALNSNTQNFHANWLHCGESLCLLSESRLERFFLRLCFVEPTLPQYRGILPPEKHSDLSLRTLSHFTEECLVVLGNNWFSFVHTSISKHRKSELLIW